MPRVVKLVEVRRSELVDAAEALFFAKGYDATTVADIIAQAGVSKGGFYHHFESKEELLDAVIARLIEQVAGMAADIVADPSLDALTKINRSLARGMQWKVAAAPSMRGMFLLVLKPENAALYQRMVKAAVTTLAPLLAEIVKQGLREKVFDVPEPQIVAQMLLHLVNDRFAVAGEAIQILQHGDIDKASEMLEQRMAAEEAIINRLLGLAAGSIRLTQPGQIGTMLKAIV